MTSSPALVISTIKYGEADLIARLFVREKGLVAFMLKGARKSRRGRLKPAYFQPLNQLEIVFQHRNKGSLEYLRDLKVAYPYEQMHGSIIKSSITLFFSELLTQLISEQEADPQLYDYLALAFRLLDQEDLVANYPLKILLDMTRFFGFYPSLSRKRDSYFNLQEASFETEASSTSHVTLQSSKVIYDLVGMKFEEVGAYGIGRAQRIETLRDLVRFYNIHLHTFKAPASLEILSQLFDDYSAS